MLEKSSYSDYILERLFEQDREDNMNRSELASQLDSSIIQQRNMSYPKLSSKSNIKYEDVQEEEDEGKTNEDEDVDIHYEDDQASDHDDDGGEEEQIDDMKEENDINENIINTHPKRFFSKVLAVFSQDYNIFRGLVLSKLIDGVILNKKVRGGIGMSGKSSSFDPLVFFEDQENKRKKSSLETYGYQKRLIRFDFDNGKLIIYNNRTKTGKSPAKRKDVSDDKVLVVNNKWVLEEEYELDDLKDILLPEVTSKMLKSRMKVFYQPSQFGVYNQAELQYLEKCNYFPFILELSGKTRLECLADDIGILLDIYSGINYLLL